MLTLNDTGNCTVTGTENHPEAFNGGSLTVRGGLHIMGDTVVGGNLMVSGDIFVFDSVGSPVISLQDCSNIIAAAGKRSRLKKEPGGERYLTVNFSVTPLLAGQWSYFTFPLPDRITYFAHPTDAASMATGFTESPTVSPLNDVMCSVVQGTNLGRVFFRATAFATQYIHTEFRYTV